jgi:hypothetical protein
MKDNSHVGIMVWCAVTWNALIGPLFPEGKIDAVVYLGMTTKEYLPLLREQTPTRSTWFQPDGAPTRTAGTPVNLLNGLFKGRWIEKGSSHAWPAGSPDLTVPDYWLWNWLLQSINADSPTTKGNCRLAVGL